MFIDEQLTSALLFKGHHEICVIQGDDASSANLRATIAVWAGMRYHQATMLSSANS